MSSRSVVGKIHHRTAKSKIPEKYRLSYLSQNTRVTKDAGSVVLEYTIILSPLDRPCAVSEIVSSEVSSERRSRFRREGPLNAAVPYTKSCSLRDSVWSLVFPW